MSITKITYANKSAINSNSGVADTNKVNATDMNEIKTVVNNNADNIGDMANLVNGTSLVGALTNSTSYSTTNEIAIGTWVDNKTIYRKTFYVATLPNNNFTNIAHNIANMDELVNIYGIMRTPGNHTTVGFNMTGTSAIYGSGIILVVRADRTNIVLGTTGNFTSNVAYITLEYTKTS